MNSGVRCWDLNRSKVISSKSIRFTLHAAAEIKNRRGQDMDNRTGDGASPAEDDDGAGGLRQPVGVQLDGPHGEASGSFACSWPPAPRYAVESMELCSSAAASFLSGRRRRRRLCCRVRGRASAETPDPTSPFQRLRLTQ